MQIAIKPEEKKALIEVTKPYGRTGWFVQIAGISKNTLIKLKTLGVAEEEIVARVRVALKNKEVRQLIKTDSGAVAM